MQTTCVHTEPGMEKTALPMLGLTWWSKVRAAWQGVLDKLAPLGYEDQTGFHLGMEPSGGGDGSSPQGARY